MGQLYAVALCLHRPQPSKPVGREGSDGSRSPGSPSHNRFSASAFPAPNNLGETQLPLKQTFIQVVPPVWLPLLPVEVLVIVDTVEVVLCSGLVPGVRLAISDTRPKAGGYQVVQRGYELLVDHE